MAIYTIYFVQFYPIIFNPLSVISLFTHFYTILSIVVVLNFMLYSVKETFPIYSFSYALTNVKLSAEIVLF